MINHVYGNMKINILKRFKKFIEMSILFFLSFFYKFNSSQKIIISSAMYAPWLADRTFFKLYSKLKNLTIVDEAGDDASIQTLKDGKKNWFLVNLR